MKEQPNRRETPTVSICWPLEIILNARFSWRKVAPSERGNLGSAV